METVSNVFIDDAFECACGICRSAWDDAFYEKDLIRNRIHGHLESLTDFQREWV
jgi:hypothetical protein